MVMGAEGQLEIDSVRYSFLKFTSQTVRVLTDNADQTITGQLDPYDDNAQPGLTFVGMRVHMQPTQAEWVTLCPLFLDGVGPFTSGDEFVQFPVSIDLGDAIHTYTNCGVDKVTVSGQKGSTPITLTLDLMGLTETVGAETFLTLTPGLGFAFEEGVMTHGGAVRPYDRFQLTIDRQLYRDFNNSKTATCLAPSGNKMSLSTSVPYITASPDNTTLYTSEVAATGSAGSLVFTRGSNTMTIAFAALQSVMRAPSNKGRDKEVRLPLEYNVRATTAAVAITITFV
tara:strand:- start:4019 stop:4870 length:852 start_codon:yes stop_codon:yes gene_type:complete